MRVYGEGDKIRVRRDRKDVVACSVLRDFSQE